MLTLEENFSMEQVLFLGAGAFGMPIHLSRHWPEARVDVAEIDPEVIEVGRQFFGLDEQPQVEAHASDGRVFLQLSEEDKYDLIFGDAYSGVSYIPPHMVTREFFELVDSRLRVDGIYMMNVIGSLKGDGSGVVSGILATLTGVFPYIEVFPVHSRDVFLRQNVIIMASQRSLDVYSGALSSLSGELKPWQRIVRNHVPRSHLEEAYEVRQFTDYHNPIDKILGDILLAR